MSLNLSSSTWISLCRLLVGHLLWLCWCYWCLESLLLLHRWLLVALLHRLLWITSHLLLLWLVLLGSEALDAVEPSSVVLPCIYRTSCFHWCEWLSVVVVISHRVPDVLVIDHNHHSSVWVLWIVRQLMLDYHFPLLFLLACLLACVRYLVHCDNLPDKFVCHTLVI